MREKLIFRMYTGIRFNRPIILGKDYISPGGYEIKCGETVIAFDFENTEISVNNRDPRLLDVMQKNPDYEAFEGLENLTLDMLRHISEIPEFFVFTGEPGETDLKPVGVEYIVFTSPYGEWEDISIPDHIVHRIEVGCSW